MRRGSRFARAVTWVSIGLIVVSLVVMARALPVDRGVDGIGAWIEGLGAWGPAAYALIYAAAVVLLAPGSVLTLGAGAIFGLGWGLVAAWFGSTVGAAAAFLIARHLARARVARMIARRPRFSAVDGAIGRGGWRIVALLRLTPVVPFSVANYAFGVTSIRFWPYVLASWLFMLPGAFLYVYSASWAARGWRRRAGGRGPGAPAPGSGRPAARGWRPRWPS